jgi:hypothetical protein
MATDGYNAQFVGQVRLDFGTGLVGELTDQPGAKRLIPQESKILFQSRWNRRQSRG